MQFLQLIDPLSFWKILAIAIVLHWIEIGDSVARDGKLHYTHDFTFLWKVSSDRMDYEIVK